MKSTPWSSGRRGEARLCRSCSERAHNKPAPHCAEPRHAALFESCCQRANNERLKRNARRKTLGLTEAMMRGHGVSRRGRRIEPDLPDEEWRPFADNYRVSNFGRVRGRWGWLLRQQRTPDGYMMITIKLTDGAKVNLLVHRLVCEAFHGLCPAGMQVAHGDGNPANNVSANLRWATPLENAADKRLHAAARRVV